MSLLGSKVRFMSLPRLSRANTLAMNLIRLMSAPAAMSLGLITVAASSSPNHIMMLPDAALVSSGNNPPALIIAVGVGDGGLADLSYPGEYVERGEHQPLMPQPNYVCLLNVLHRHQDDLVSWRLFGFWQGERLGEVNDRGSSWRELTLSDRRLDDPRPSRAFSTRSSASSLAICASASARSKPWSLAKWKRLPSVSFRSRSARKVSHFLANPSLSSPDLDAASGEPSYQLHKSSNPSAPRPA